MSGVDNGDALFDLTTLASSICRFPQDFADKMQGYWLLGSRRWMELLAKLAGDGSSF
jgi:hypothetical protein